MQLEVVPPLLVLDLAVGAHPDDLDFGAAGTIASWTDAGIEVSYCICTDGDAGGFDPDVPRSEIGGIRQAEQRAEMDALKGEGSSWGNQMRSYVLHPYQMVKDLRTEFEVGNPSAVLDGDIDGFIEAGIRWRKSTETAANL